MTLLLIDITALRICTWRISVENFKLKRGGTWLGFPVRSAATCFVRPAWLDRWWRSRAKVVTETLRRSATICQQQSRACNAEFWLKDAQGSSGDIGQNCYIYIYILFPNLRSVGRPAKSGWRHSGGKGVLRLMAA